MNSKIKFGIIGCSRIAKKSVIPSIINSENAEIEIIGSRSSEIAKETSNHFNCKKYGSYEDVISDENVDAVYISTPIGTHEEWAIKAASSGVFRNNPQEIDHKVACYKPYPDFVTS